MARRSDGPRMEEREGGEEEGEPGPARKGKAVTYVTVHYAGPEAA